MEGEAPKLNVTALRNVCRALRESPNPSSESPNSSSGFTMGVYARECGAPACCLGHYAMRHDLQNIFEISTMQRLKLIGGNDVDFDDDPVLKHFGIDIYESHELFSGIGCNKAKTPEEAAQFIENFIKEKGYGESVT